MLDCLPPAAIENLQKSNIIYNYLFAEIPQLLATKYTTNRSICDIFCIIIDVYLQISIYLNLTV